MQAVEEALYFARRNVPKVLTSEEKENNVKKNPVPLSVPLKFCLYTYFTGDRVNGPTGHLNRNFSPVISPVNLSS
jgi:hypothetical protein